MALDFHTAVHETRARQRMSGADRHVDDGQVNRAVTTTMYGMDGMLGDRNCLVINEPRRKNADTAHIVFVLDWRLGHEVLADVFVVLVM